MGRYLEFMHLRTREVASRIDVTGKSEREVERITRGMLINIGEDWFVNDTDEADAEGTEPEVSGEAAPSPAGSGRTP